MADGPDRHGDRAVIDLTRPDETLDRAPDPQPPANARRVIIAIAALVGLVIVGAALFDNDDASDPDGELQPLNEAVPQPEPTIRAAPQANQLTRLAGADELAAAVRLAPGADPSFALLIDPVAPVSIVSRSAAPPAILLLDSPELEGFPIATVAGGILVVPSDKSLGALIYWNEDGVLELPIPSEPESTSYLVAAGDTAVLLSAGEVVVMDMRARTEVLRTAARIAGSTLARACLSPDQTRLALTTAAGSGIVLDVATGAEILTYSTSVPSGGVTWATEAQLIHLQDDSGTLLVWATDIDSRETRVVATALADNPWQLASSGPGC